MPLVALLLAGPLSAATFLNPETPETRLQTALAARDLRPQLQILRSGRVSPRSEPDRRLAVRMVGAMIMPPPNWREWMGTTERQIAARPLYYGELRSVLGYHLAVRRPGPESLAYQLGMNTDGASTATQLGYASLLMKESGYRFWTYAASGLPMLSGTMRERARATIGGAIATDSPVIAPGHLALARKRLPKADVPGVLSGYRRWKGRD